jgi:hypothetical protein
MWKVQSYHWVNSQISVLIWVAQICDQEKFAAICKDLTHDIKHATCTINIKKLNLRFHNAIIVKEIS